MALVEVSDLVKVYSGGVRALDGISFEVQAGETFGFLGPNGAGKTTAIRILVTLLKPTAGRAAIDGIDVLADPHGVRQRVGYAAQFIGLDNDLTGRENLVLQARLHGVSRQEAERRAAELLEVIQLSEAAGRRAGTYSGGMRRRLDLAQALMHQPRLVFLDEPTTGLDPQNRRALWDYLAGLNESGVTIFLTTQYLEEADELCDRLAIIDQGAIVVAGTPAGLKAGLGGDVVSVTVPAGGPPDLLARTRELLAAVPGAGETKTFDHSVAVYVPDASGRLAAIVRELDAADIPVERLELAHPSLDEVFLRYTGERLRVEEVRRPSRVLRGARRGRG